MRQHLHTRLKFLLEIKEMTNFKSGIGVSRIDKDVETPSKQTVDADFNFDLERMKKTVNAKSCKMQQTNSFEEFDAWINK